jgi:hypothetical protein
MPVWILISLRMLVGAASARMLPASGLALLEAAVFYLATSVVDAALVLPNGHAIGFGCADLAFATLATASILWVCRRWHRFPQVLLGMLAIGSWLTLPSIVVNAGWPPTLGADGVRHMALWAQLLLAGVLCWSIVVIARLFRDALDLDWNTAIAISLFYFLTDYAVLIVLPDRIFH